MYNITIEGLIWRFYLMMLIVIIPFYLGHGIFALVALPILLSAMFGISFKHAKKEETTRIKEKEKSISAAVRSLDHPDLI